jgi:hypothetical protein
MPGMPKQLDQIPRHVEASEGVQPSPSAATMSHATTSATTPTAGNFEPSTPLLTSSQSQSEKTNLGESEEVTSEPSSQSKPPPAAPASPHSQPSVTIPAASTPVSGSAVNGELHPNPAASVAHPPASSHHGSQQSKLNIDVDWWFVLFLNVACLVVTSVYVFAMTTTDNQALNRWVPLGVSSSLVILIITTEVVGILLIELCSSTLQTIGWWCATSSRPMSVASFLGISPTTSFPGLFRLSVWSVSRRWAVWLWLGLR